MNFLEARKAALEGKKVKIKEHDFIYTSSQFNSLIIDALVLDSEWEVIEDKEPKKDITRKLDTLEFLAKASKLVDMINKLRDDGKVHINGAGLTLPQVLKLGEWIQDTFGEPEEDAEDVLQKAINNLDGGELVSW